MGVVISKRQVVRLLTAKLEHIFSATCSCLPTFPEWTIHPPISEDNIAHAATSLGHGRS